MMPMCVQRLKEVNDKMLEWLNEHYENDEDLFHALHHIGFAPSELDVDTRARVSDYYRALPARECLEMKIQAEYAEFKSFWRGLSIDELTDQAEKIAVVNRLMHEMSSSCTDEQAEYFALFCEPLEAVSETIMNGDFAHESEIVSLALGNMYDSGDGGAYYDMEEEYYQDDEEMNNEQKM